MLENNNKKVSKINIRWSELDWRHINQRVFRIQKQIYNYSLENRSKVDIHRLQNILTNLFECKLLAVRRVTQDNAGKNTAGVDQKKALTPIQRVKLAKNISIDGKAEKIRRVWLPKPNSKELRPLGIPTIQDRAKQALALMALEPEWEAKFEPNSYGFRPGRGCHDTIEAIHSSINKKPKYVLDADIRKCFDSINHKALLKKLNTYGKMHRMIKAWIKTGILDKQETLFPIAGTPQGGVISPFLSNVALHGMENMLKDWVSQFPAYNPGKSSLSKIARKSRLTLVRYADDFVLLHPEENIIRAAKELISEWLSEMGLELHPLKTSIKHTYTSIGNTKPGFKFVGFWIRNYPVQTPDQAKRKAGYRTYIRPHPDNISKVLLNIKKVLASHTDIKTIIKRLNPIIIGWSNYYRTVSSKKTFSAMDKNLITKLILWACKKHPKRNKRWIIDKYLYKTSFAGRNKNRFGFYEKNNLLYVKSFAETKIVRHNKIKGPASPYDGDWIYWVLRRQDVANRRLSLQKTILNQKGKCKICNLYFTSFDQIEIDHIIPTKDGGKSTYANLQAVHRHCHDIKHGNKISSIEEPYDGKPSRTVLN